MQVSVDSSGRTTALAEQPEPSPSVATQAGRGGIAVAIAKIYFLIVGLVQQVLLTRVLGTGAYGAWSTVSSVASMVYNPVVTTGIQGVSRTVARSSDETRPQVIRRTLTWHAFMAPVLAGAFLVLAGPIMRWAHAPHLVNPLRWLSLVLLFYGLYAPLVGVLNGQRRFIAQASLDMLYATLRTIALIGMAYLFQRTARSGVVGACLGFGLVAATIAIVAMPFATLGKRGPGGPGILAYLSFVGPLFLGQVLLNLLQQSDLSLLRYFAALSAKAAHLPPEAADPLVGAYRATQLFCFLPYQLLLSITFILFPLLASAHRDRDDERIAVYVQTGVRLALIVAGAMVALTSGLSGPLLRLVFPADVATLATRSMQLLSLGFGAFALFGILTTALTSLKRERASALITGVAFLLVILLGSYRLHGAPFGPDLLYRTATATSVGLLLATLVAAWLVRSTAGAVVPPSTLLRVGATLAGTVFLGRLWSPAGKLATLGAALSLGLLYFLVLLLSRELRRSDLDQVLAIFRRRPSGTKTE